MFHWCWHYPSHDLLPVSVSICPTFASQQQRTEEACCLMRSWQAEVNKDGNWVAQKSTYLSSLTLITTSTFGTKIAMLITSVHPSILLTRTGFLAAPCLLLGLISAAILCCITWQALPHRHALAARVIAYYANGSGNTFGLGCLQWLRADSNVFLWKTTIFKKTAPTSQYQFIDTCTVF